MNEFDFSTLFLQNDKIPSYDKFLLWSMRNKLQYPSPNPFLYIY